MGYSFRLAARVLLYASSHRQDNTYPSLCYTSRGALAGTRNSAMGPPHEGSIRRPIAPWANSLTMELHLAPLRKEVNILFNGAHNTFYLWLYGVGHMVKDLLDRESGNSFWLADTIVHSTTVVTPVVEYWLEQEREHNGSTMRNWSKVPLLHPCYWAILCPMPT